MKYSLVIALLLASSVNCEATAATTPTAPPTPPPTTAASDVMKTAGGMAVAATSGDSKDAMNKAMDSAIKDAETKIPDSISVGPKTVKVDTAAVKDMMETERKFWRTDARKVEDLVNVVLTEPLMRTEARIAASMATILKPASELLPLIGNMVPDGSTCNVAGFVDCLWGSPARDRRGPRIFQGKCATDNKCVPKVGYKPDMTDDDRKALRENNNKGRDTQRRLERAVSRLADQVA